jgi:hypothetical protein
MQREDLFRSDIVQSERNYFKITLTYSKLTPSTSKSRELGLVSCLVNIPSRYLVERRERHVVNQFVRVLAKHTGIFFDGKTDRQLSVVNRKAYALECNYLLKSLITGNLRSWSGSVNLRGRNTADQRAGVLAEFQPLVSPDQIVNTLRQFSDGRAIEEKIVDAFAGVQTDYVYAGCVSLVILAYFRGYFPREFRPDNVKEILNNDDGER